jgi:hypothetical protein
MKDAIGMPQKAIPVPDLGPACTICSQKKQLIVLMPFSESSTSWSTTLSDQSRVETQPCACQLFDHHRLQLLTDQFFPRQSCPF